MKSDREHIYTPKHISSKPILDRDIGAQAKVKEENEQKLTQKESIILSKKLAQIHAGQQFAEMPK